MPFYLGLGRQGFHRCITTCNQMAQRNRTRRSDHAGYWRLRQHLVFRNLSSSGTDLQALAVRVALPEKPCRAQVWARCWQTIQHMYCKLQNLCCACSGVVTSKEICHRYTALVSPPLVMTRTFELTSYDPVRMPLPEPANMYQNVLPLFEGRCTLK